MSETIDISVQRYHSDWKWVWVSGKEEIFVDISKYSTTNIEDQSVLD